jgi:hypothetical protein
MAVDNGIVVAISSFASALVAGGITLISKLLDTIQKRNEQAMVIKTTYVNKKIETGQKFVSRTNVLIYNNYYKIAHMDEEIKTGKSNEQLIAIINEIHDSIKDAYLKQDDSTELFFDISDMNKKYDVVVQEMNIHGFELKELELGTKEYMAKAKIIIEYYEKIIEILLESNAVVRNELKKYDIV